MMSLIAIFICTSLDTLLSDLNPLNPILGILELSRTKATSTSSKNSKNAISGMKFFTFFYFAAVFASALECPSPCDPDSFCIEEDGEKFCLGNLLI